MNSVVKNVALALARHSIHITLEDMNDEEVYCTVEKEGVAYSLYLNSDSYAGFSETYFNMDIGYDERVIFEEDNYDLETLVGKIADIMNDQIEMIRREVECMMLLEGDEENI